MMTQPVNRWLWPLAVVICAAVPALGQETENGTAQSAIEIGPDDWQVRCETAGCLVLKSVPLDAGGRRLLLTFAVPQGQGAVRMALITPLGSDLDKGVRLQLGASDATYRFSTCMADGCVIVAELSPDDIEIMRVQPQMTATFSAVNRAEPYAVDIPLADFGEAIRVAREGLQP